MAIVWPLTLPAPLVEGYTETPPTLTLRSNMDSGPPKVRRRFTAGITVIECMLVLTRPQVATLDDFYVVTTGGGALSFEWVDHRREVTVNARFKDAPSYRPQDSVEVWKASMTLEILPPGMAVALDASVAARQALDRDALR